MRTERYPARDLIKLFKQHTIATMGQLKEALGTEAEATVFRKLAELSYRTSYSHRGGYYTLDTIPVLRRQTTVAGTRDQGVNGAERGWRRQRGYARTCPRYERASCRRWVVMS
jgi:hypothetical protein